MLIASTTAFYCWRFFEFCGNQLRSREEQLLLTATVSGLRTSQQCFQPRVLLNSWWGGVEDVYLSGRPAEHRVMQYRMLQESLQKMTETRGDDKHQVLIISGGIIIHHCDLLAFILKPKWGYWLLLPAAATPLISSCPPRTPSSPGTGPQRAPNLVLGSTCLRAGSRFCPWHQFFLKPPLAFPKCTVQFHTGWITGVSLIMIVEQV